MQLVYVPTIIIPHLNKHVDSGHKLHLAESLPIQAKTMLKESNQIKGYAEHRVLVKLLPNWGLPRWKYTRVVVVSVLLNHR